MNLSQIVITVLCVGFVVLIVTAFVRAKRGMLHGSGGMFVVFEEIFSPAQYNVRIAIEQQADLPAEQQAPGDPLH
ncbi:hypothetical protein CLV47_111105 [Antricoccus suffuscus]|uniref:Uncharacterized protein n=1 Tax=Antricoccus suffuscus TaxID=1629062 RepID=A0A2T0ZYQ7_9ACTN|nr:hypothetical protein [Antricoccus suffuscus]PRZ41228.1 hypothetical protein CLV47_111105 [Antricoccus suffuscus]